MRTRISGRRALDALSAVPVSFRESLVIALFVNQPPVQGSTAVDRRAPELTFSFRHRGECRWTAVHQADAPALEYRATLNHRVALWGRILGRRPAPPTEDLPSQMSAWRSPPSRQ